MGKIKNLRIILFIIALITLVLLGIIYYVTSQKNPAQQEILREETTISLKGVTDSRKIAYETDNAIIKISYTEVKEYILSQIKHSQDSIEKVDLPVKKYHEDVISEGGKLINLLEDQKDKNEINITSALYKDYLKNIDIDVLMTISLKNGEAEVYDRSNSQKVDFIKFKGSEAETYYAYRYYLPDDKVFYESLDPIFR